MSYDLSLINPTESIKLLGQANVQSILMLNVEKTSALTDVLLYTQKYIRNAGCTNHRF